MRPKIVIPALIVLLFALAIPFWRQHKQLHHAPIDAQVDQSAADVSNPPTAIKKTSGASQAIASPQANQSLTPSAGERTNEIRQYMESQNVPVKFYGKAIDQDGYALAGVKVTGEILHVKVVAPVPWGDQDEIVPFNQETDLSGRFEIHEVSGRSLQIESLKKSGYEPEPGQRTYSAIVGSLENPVVFKMWNTKVHKQLMGADKKFQIVPDGRIYSINLTDGTISESGEGDLRIYVKRPNGVKDGDRFDWSCGMTIANGGLLQETDGNSPMYSAPIFGYAPSFQYEQAIGSGWGDSTGTRRFYISLGNGKTYGRMSIEIYAFYNDQIPGLIRLQYAINPSGSTVLR